MKKEYSPIDKVNWMFNKINDIDNSFCYVMKWDFDKLDFSKFNDIGLGLVYVNVLKAQIEIHEWEIKMDGFIQKNNLPFTKWYPSIKDRNKIIDKIKRNKERLAKLEPITEICKDLSVQLNI